MTVTEGFWLIQEILFVFNLLNKPKHSTAICPPACINSNMLAYRDVKIFEIKAKFASCSRAFGLCDDGIGVYLDATCSSCKYSQHPVCVSNCFWLAFAILQASFAQPSSLHDCNRETVSELHSMKRQTCFISKKFT